MYEDVKHVIDWDDLVNHMGELIVLHIPSTKKNVYGGHQASDDRQNYTFVNYSDERIVCLTQLSNYSNYFKVEPTTSVFFKNVVSHEWNNTGRNVYDGLLLTFVPQMSKNFIHHKCFEFSNYLNMKPTLVDAKMGTIDIFENYYAFTETIVDYDNFKWYRLHISNSSLNKRIANLNLVHTQTHNARYVVTNFDSKHMNFFFVRNEHNKTWLEVDDKMLKRYKASRDYLNAIKIANILDN